ncbi:hypothetical protein ALQ50_02606 [Pseudomonas coronafaciens pv. coronafaciens]|uniref:DUF3613 domain-containing protein n=1 Tax=Pseudomonas coronafaciens TaxID=53409 RepID=UPI000EFE14F8|nr:DUF3613 domain-containing protein [Pseudomonas coronafaciens]RMN97921.1 hypothetical protein ALQ50_02606 [Pseudomonas coronafaciens pv. coronafaciens]
MRSLIVSIAMLLSASNTLANDDARPLTEQKQTETWLQLQASGKAASPKTQAATATERDLSLQRWLDTYKNKIPEFYEQDAGGSFSSGSK